MQRDPALAARIHANYAWLSQALAQILDGAPWEIDLSVDPMGSLRAIDAMRSDLEHSGIPVPAIVDPDDDPLGNMTAWRDFLAKLVTVH